MSGPRPRKKIEMGCPPGSGWSYPYSLLTPTAVAYHRHRLLLTMSYVYHARSMLRNKRIASKTYRLSKETVNVYRQKLHPQKWQLQHIMFHTTPRNFPKQTRNFSRMTTRYVTVYDEPFPVRMPAGYNLYEGLQRWYPNLYQIVIQEDLENDFNYHPSHEDYDELWDRMDYMEWMSD